jgi:MFS family permease
MSATVEATLAMPRSAGSRWALTVLVAAAIFINYIDRGNLATAAPLIKTALHLSNLQIGLLTSAFFAAYVPAQIGAGWAVDRLGGFLALALGFALWSLATALTGLAGGFAALIGLRVLLGLGEAVAFPGMSKLFAESVPAAEQGLANSIAQAGLSLGPAVGVLAGGALMAALGWRPMFVIFGAAALLWLIPWSFYGRSVRRSAPRQQLSPPPYREILSQRALWGATLGHFSGLIGLYFVLSWMPLWLVAQRGFSLIEMSRLLAAVYVVAAIASMLSGWLCDRLIAAGYSLNRVRKGMSVIAHVGGAVGLAGCAAGNARIVVLSLFFSATSLLMTALWPITQTLAGPRAAGRWVGIQNCLANIAGIIGPAVTGWIVDKTGSFNAAFILAALVVIAGAFAWGLVIERVEPVTWDSYSEEPVPS